MFSVSLGPTPGLAAGGSLGSELGSLFCGPLLGCEVLAGGAEGNLFCRILSLCWKNQSPRAWAGLLAASPRDRPSLQVRSLGLVGPLGVRSRGGRCGVGGA